MKINPHQSPDHARVWIDWILQTSPDPWPMWLSLPPRHRATLHYMEERLGEIPEVPYSITYSIVTPESAEHGDFAEHGYTLPGGYRYPCPPGLQGADFRAWADQFERGLPLRELAADMIHDGFHFDVETDCATLTSSDMDAETTDGDAGWETLNWHIHDIELAAIVRHLVQAGDPGLAIPHP